MTEKRTVKVWFDDCQGRLADGEIVEPANWSAWAAKRAAVSDDRGVVLVDGTEFVVVPVYEPTRIFWKAI